MTAPGPDEQAPVLAGIDGSAGSRAALRAAARIAEALDAPLEVLMLWEGPPLYEGWDVVDPDRPPEGSVRLLRESLAEVFGERLPAGVRARLVHGRPAERLVAESGRAQLLVVGRRGHSGLRSAAPGSVSTACVGHAHCPVMVVKH
ncbi:universal stress protein [Kocuria flava]|uniref:universal stress protein n=1 Tax=Kocuria flava TaxID=446860 RepID=UPI003F1E0D1C